jgi:prephenate dehydrogenase
VRVFTQLIKAIGAEPYFIDPFEHDALSSAITTLPFVLTSALVRLVGDSASVRDLKRLAPPEFRRLTAIAQSPHERSSLGLAVADLAGRGAGFDGDAAGTIGQARAAGGPAQSPHPLLAWLDGLVDGLGELRAAIATGDQAALGAWMDAAQSAAEAWEVAAEPEHHSAAIEELRSRNVVSDTLFGRLRRGRD